MNILSLFDGISCGQLALERAGIPVTNYYASEIDKYAIKITQKNFPNTIQVGDVTKLDLSSLPLIDLLLGGSPCQGFSRAGKQQNFNDPRSGLFFSYVVALHTLRPRYFLFENVSRMDKFSKNIMTAFLGVEPIEINSALVSAQNRERLYWTNIPGIQQPEDKCILLKDIIEDGLVDRDKSYRIDANYHKGGSLKNYLNKKRRQLVMHQSEKRLMVQVDTPVRIGTANGIAGHDYNRRVYSTEGKSPTLNSVSGGNLHPKIALGETWRILTPLECERLQTVREGYTEGVSNTQRYRMLGNGWTVDVIAHILSYMER